MILDTVGDYNFQKYIWFSPQHVIGAVNHLAKLYGSNIESNRDFKLVREMFDAAVALLGAYEMHPDNKYFLQANLQTASPDVVAVKQAEVVDSPLVLEINQLEMVRMNDFSQTEDLLEFLKKTKLSPKKSYDNKTIIICVVDKKIQINRKNIAAGLKKTKPKSTIYILGKLRDDNDKWTIFSPYPDLTIFTTFYLSKTINKYNLPSPVRLYRGISKNITYTRTEPIKLSIYDIFNLKEENIQKYLKV